MKGTGHHFQHLVKRRSGSKTKQVYLAIHSTRKNNNPPISWIYRISSNIRGPFLESPDNFSAPESYFVCAMFAFKTQILLVLKTEQ